MRETDSKPRSSDPVAQFAAGRWNQLRRSLSAKLITLMLTSLVIIFALLGYLNIQLHRRHLEAARLAAAERISNTLKRTATYDMLRNDREGLHQSIRAVANEPGIVHVRIINQQGRISYSSNPQEVGTQLNPIADGCTGCHAGATRVPRLNNGDKFRVYREAGVRYLAIITPIENQLACSNASCHAHAASSQILGVLDTSVSLQQADVDLRETTRRMAAYTAVALFAIALINGGLIFHIVDRPVKTLIAGTEQLGKGDLGFQIEVESQDELGELATSFNAMSVQLRQANQEIQAWAHTLEDKIEEKTRELKNTHEHMLQVETMTSLGKLAAVVAHEINNPLSGILTYSKLLKKWMEKLEIQDTRRKEITECLDLIESESRRCGELVKNLLTFSRSAPLNIQTSDLNQVLDRCARLVRPQLEVSSINLQLELASNLPAVQCDPAQLEQVVLALVMNAVDAMPRGGNLWLCTRRLPDGDQVEIQVRDDGTGIPPNLLPKLFQPFFTTKDRGKGVGLGLAISQGIVERHNGTIEVQSQLGKGTTFFISLPMDTKLASQPSALPVATAGARG